MAFHRLRNFPSPEMLSIASFRALPCAALRASVVDVDVRLFITLGNAPPSFMIFPVFQSNKATWLSTAEAGPTTSPAPSPSAPSDTVNVVVFQLVSVISIVCVFPDVVSVMVDIQFPVGPVGHCGHVAPVAPVAPVSHFSPCSHCGHVSVVFAFASVTEFPSVSQNTMSSPLKVALLILAPVAPVSPVSPCGHCSPCGHWIP